MLFDDEQLRDKTDFNGFDFSKIDPSFQDFFNQEAKQDYFKNLEAFLISEYKNYTIFPPSWQIFRVFEITSLKDIKVVILGQDPYHEIHQAEGLAFSASKAKRTPSSLVNILKEVEIEYGKTIISASDLLPWSTQGVFLLNTVLSVREGEANSHADKGWEIFTNNAIGYLAKNLNNIVFMLFGQSARSKKDLILKSSTLDNLIIENVHPSPLSAHRGFFNSDMFKKANNYLSMHKKKPIVW